MEVQLLVGGVESREQVEHFVMNFMRTGVAAIDLVDQHDRTQAEGERLAGDELGLRHRAFGRVDQHHHAVDHRQDTLDLAAEIGVAGGVDDVDAGIFPHDAGALGQNRDATFLFQVVAVHHALVNLLVFAEGAGLAEHGVDKGGLAMVDVGDDGDVTKVHDTHTAERVDSTKRARLVSGRGPIWLITSAAQMLPVRAQSAASRPWVYA